MPLRLRPVRGGRQLHTCGWGGSNVARRCRGGTPPSLRPVICAQARGVGSELAWTERYDYNLKLSSTVFQGLR